MINDARVRRQLKLRDFDTLLAVSRHGSMAKAAAYLSVSQPTVSKAIADMEHTLGVPLFDRTAQGVEPTRYGQVLLKSAVAVFDDVRQGMTEIEFLADPTVGELRVGASEPMLGGFLAAVLADLHRQHPRIEFKVTQPSSVAQQRRELRERAVDLIVGRVMRTESEEDIATEVLFEEPWAVVSGVQNPLARRRKLALADLLNESCDSAAERRRHRPLHDQSVPSRRHRAPAFSRHLRLDPDASRADYGRTIPCDLSALAAALQRELDVGQGLAGPVARASAAGRHQHLEGPDAQPGDPAFHCPRARTGETVGKNKSHCVISAPIREGPLTEGMRVSLGHRLRDRFAYPVRTSRGSSIGLKQGPWHRSVASPRIDFRSSISGARWTSGHTAQRGPACR